MGLSASQARYLSLTARKNDNEYEAQQVNQQRLEVAKKLQDISLKYNDGMNNRQLLFVSKAVEGNDTEKVKLNYTSITAAAPEGLGYRLVTKEGIEVCPESKKADMDEKVSKCYDDRCLDSVYIQEQLRSGNWMLQKPSETETDEYGKRTWENIHYSGVGNIEDSLDTSDDAGVSAEYEDKLAYFQHKDKELELHLQQLQTSHNAIQTEMDAVKKVIDKNVEKTFKTFG